MARKITKKGLWQKAWDKQRKEIISEQIDFQGYVTCYTCLKSLLAKECQIGHFWHNKLDFDKRNLRIQCLRCNHFLGGNLGAYAARLIKENGMDWFDQLERDAAQYKAEGIKQLKQLLTNHANQ